MEKKRLVYVDYWSHKYTKGDFLREIFSEEFEINDLTKLFFRLSK